jgi:SPX domain protein involved in polyphosphate accumulation
VPQAVSSNGQLAATRHAINRFEVKYFVATKSVPSMLEELSPYTRIDSNADPGQGYPIFSIYWDTARLAFFWEKIEGLSNRRKLRFRRYGDNGHVYIEVKQREDRTLQKRRLKWPLARVIEVFGHGRGVDWASLGDDPVAVEVAHMIDGLSLRPTMGIRYRRRALQGAFDPDVRVTFDSRIMYRPALLDLANPFDTGSYVVDPRITVLEIKYDNRVPRWLTKFISRHGLKIVRMSKYCSAVDLYRFGGQNT